MSRNQAQGAGKAPSITILQAMGDPNLFAPWFRRGDWGRWRAFLAALFGLPMAEEKQRIAFEACTGRDPAGIPPDGFSEAWAICGRRSGKSFITALAGAFLAAFSDYRAHLQPGEVATVMLIACDRKQARVLMRYVSGFFTECRLLAGLVERMTDEQIELTNRVTIEIVTASMRSVRGYTIAAVLADETAYWRTEESANPDAEILNALRPGMATIPGAKMLCIGSPYARRGEMFNAHRRYYGQDDAPVLVWQAPSRVMNPSLPQKVVDAALARDAASAQAEYLAEFRSDLEAFLTRETVESAVRDGPLELPPRPGVAYSAFTDPSGGMADGFTLAIGHAEGERLVVDVIRERKHVAPAAVVQEYGALLKAYGLAGVQGDRYAGEWPRQEFARHGITYEPSAKPKSEIYLDVLAVLNNGRAELPPDPVLINQFATLERRTARSGKDSVDHAPGAHDDRANAVAGLIAQLAGQVHGPLEIWTSPGIGAQIIAEELDGGLPSLGRSGLGDWYS